MSSVAEKLLDDDYTFFVLDDDEEALEVLEHILQSEYPMSHFDFTTSPYELLDKIKAGIIPDLIITDLKMPEMDGITFLKSVMKVNSQIPVILNSAYTDDISVLSYAKYGFAGVNNKKKAHSTLIDNVRNALNSLEETDSSYLSAPIDMLNEMTSIPFNIYLKVDTKLIHVLKKDHQLTTDHFDRIVSKGFSRIYINKSEYINSDDDMFFQFHITMLMKNEKIPFSLFSKSKDGNYVRIMPKDTVYNDSYIGVLKKHKINKLYFNLKDEKEYKNYIDSNTSKLLHKKSLDVEQKAVILREYLIRPIRDGYKDPIGKNIGALRDASKLLEEFAKEYRGIGIYHLLCNQNINSIYQHVLNVAAINIGIYYEIIFMLNDTKLSKLVLPFEKLITDNQEGRDIFIQAGLYHDIGRMITHEVESCFELDVINYDYIEETKAVLEKSRLIKSKAIEVSLQHNEFIDGTGKPSGLFKRNLSIFSQIISLSNFYENLVNNGRLPHDAIVEIQMDEGRFNKYLIPILQRVVIASKYNK